jgi:hypothetical protein
LGLRRGRGCTCEFSSLTPENLRLGRFLPSTRPSATLIFVVGSYGHIEDVPAAGYRSDDGLRAIPQSTSDLNQTLHKGVVCDKGVLPDSVDDLFLTQETPAILGQEPEHFKGLGPELHIRAVLSQASTRKINNKPVEP